MEKLIKGYNLDTLDINNLTLDMVPDFTDEMEARRLELYNKSLAADGSFTQELRVEYATLEFLKTADTIRDRVMADGVISEDEKPQVTTALQALARVYKLKAGVDSY
jgi:hypothetical protein